jgi:acyl dehydratase
MPVPSDLVGRSTEAVVHEVDARWTMAFAAGIDDLSPRYLDTTAPGGVVAHPLFPVCLEWPAVRMARRLVSEDVLPSDEAARGIHATHHLEIERLVRPGDRLTTVATVVGVEPRSPGAFQTLRLTTTDERGDTVCVTHMGSLFLDVEVEGEPRPSPGPEPGKGPGAVATGSRSEDEVRASRAVAGNAAFVYTECARIWNPIHTDRAVAVTAGLRRPILHGTATLAMAVTEIVEGRAGGTPEAVRTIAGRFGAMVETPSSIEVLHAAGASSDDLTAVDFRVRNEAGGHAIRDGVVTLRTDMTTS